MSASQLSSVSPHPSKCYTRQAVTRELSTKLQRNPHETEVAGQMGLGLERWRRMQMELRAVGVVYATPPAKKTAIARRTCAATADYAGRFIELAASEPVCPTLPPCPSRSRRAPVRRDKHSSRPVGPRRRHVYHAVALFLRTWRMGDVPSHLASDGEHLFRMAGEFRGFVRQVQLLSHWSRSTVQRFQDVAILPRSMGEH